jgi:hypothetical protein
MRILVCGIVAAGMILGAVSAADTTTAPKKNRPKTTTRRKSVASKGAGSQATTKKGTGTASRSAGTSGTRSNTRGTTASSSSKRGAKQPVGKRTTWRNRQMAPTSDRYREIQQAMVAKGYLKPEDVSGAWDANSVDALKRFQAAQNIDATGKIDSLSLIALGLGPKRDTVSALKPAANPSPKTTGEQTPE